MTRPFKPAYNTRPDSNFKLHMIALPIKTESAH